ncbi:hypothetical protein O181_051708 [Austropuccinia psidii MF-1]|uniref:Large ribosomal subunit protein mL54 n=1 Tax=Austropuccinia psidii MF-1 TaxID=1389203 RepID=A0A9Q3E457_9BASI|nr:hypothetical protein [Austropuccinia psidii MF-1]
MRPSTLISFKLRPDQIKIPKSISIGLATISSPRLYSQSSDPSKKLTIKSKTVPISSIPAGTPLKGLAYIKGEGDPIAKADDEYPNWLWALAEPNMGAGNSDSPLQAVKRELKRDNRNKIRTANFLKAKK